MGDLVLPPRFSQRILRRSFATALCSSVAILSGRLDYAVVSLGTLGTSINYWRRPVRGGGARALDMGWVACSFAYQCWRAPRELAGRRHAAYWALAAATIGCYARARHFGRRGDLDASSSWHSGIHLVGNVANALLYADARALPVGGGASIPPGRLAACVLAWVVLAALYSRHCKAPPP